MIRGECTAGLLKLDLEKFDGLTVVFCDAEGCEHELLNPKMIPKFSTTHIIVELHEFCVPGIEILLRDRFSLSHRIIEIKSTARTSRETFMEQKHPIAARVFSSVFNHFFVERPFAQSWPYCIPRSDNV